MSDDVEEAESLVEQEVQEVTSLLEGWAFAARDFLNQNVLNFVAVYQIGLAAGTLLLALLVRSRVRRLLDRLGREKALGSIVQRLIRTVSAIAMPVCWTVGLLIGMAVFEVFGLPVDFLRLITSLLNAYIVIRIASIFIPSAQASAIFAWCAWSVAALNAVGLIDPVVVGLQGIGFRIGEAEITLWTVVKGLFVTALLIWLAFVVSEIVQRRLETSASLNAALRLLIGKITRIVLIVIAVVAGLTAVGVDLTAFAVFSGAIGIGVGLGLQRSIANLVASFSLLADRSLKPGDVVEIEKAEGSTYGVVGKMTTRYVSVRTRDGTETLMPNEVLIASPVTNWSYSDRVIRRKIPIGVAYDTDVDQAIALCCEAAAAVPRVIAEPKPVCLLKGFGDSSVDLELRFWINDPENGVSNVASQVLLEVWHRFRAAAIEIPFPQRDLNLREPLDVRLAQDT
ncbi:MAG: mechanosensitive ion channel domain-containing protein [Pseudomonadota bacterium]